MTKSAEGSGMYSSRNVWRRGAVKALTPVKTSAVKIRAMIEVPSRRIKTIAIDDCPAMRNVRVVVVLDSPVMVPIVSPMMPTPAEA
jgi:hypothetical protein